MMGQEIVDALEKDTLAKRSFRGVFSRDVLDTIEVDTRASNTFIINTAKHDEDGEHWIAVYLQSGRGEYFDSYGLPILHTEIKQFLRKHCRSIKVNKRILQGVLSNTCGYYAIYYVRRKVRGYSMDRLLIPFHPFKHYVNDRLIVKLAMQ